jgi:hypothetical protein
MWRPKFKDAPSAVFSRRESSDAVKHERIAPWRVGEPACADVWCEAAAKLWGFRVDADDGDNAGSHSYLSAIAILINYVSSNWRALMEENDTRRNLQTPRTHFRAYDIGV